MLRYYFIHFTIFNRLDRFTILCITSICIGNERIKIRTLPGTRGIAEFVIFCFFFSDKASIQMEKSQLRAKSWCVSSHYQGNKTIK